MSICNIRRKFVAILAESDNFQFISLLLYYTRYAPLLPPGWLP